MPLHKNCKLRQCQEHVVYINCSECQNKKQFVYTTCSELVVFMYWTGKSMNNILSYCGLDDVRINASDKDLPLSAIILYFSKVHSQQPVLF